MESGKKITKKALRALPAARRLYRLARKCRLREEVYERALRAAIALQKNRQK